MAKIFVYAYYTFLLHLLAKIRST